MTAPRREGARARTSPALLVVLALLGFLLVTAASTTVREKRREEPRRSRLVALILDRQKQVDDLDTQVARLRLDMARVRSAASRQSGAVRSQADRLAQLSALGGATALEGPGLTVRLTDSSRTPTGDEEASAFKIHDVDIQLVVNALFASGAEAIAINHNRLAVTSPIRAAGDTIVVNFRPLDPPYVIAAIGANRGAFLASDIARRFAHWHELFGLGFRVDDVNKVEVPAFTGRVSLAEAQPAS